VQGSADSNTLTVGETTRPDEWFHVKDGGRAATTPDPQ